jgi:lipopolysaccharide export LptBFGC system permease protein LptF
MPKRLSSTVLLFLIGIGFGIYSVTSLIHAQVLDDKIQAILYMIPAVAAFGALILLPFKQQ